MAGEKIFIVNDEKDMVDLLRLELETEGYAVAVAYDGESALELIKKEIPELVLLDVMMPGIDGYEVLRRLKADPATEEIRVVMFTAKGWDEGLQKGLDLGADDYIQKPFHPELLLKHIRAILTPPKK
jgi:DNA-binding response OmpR family regulator